ncbi:LAFA_0E21000g1_1 [Lachancea sp. 'fantastica']|nr:LAFA_0E21000g1_1 [Lachancea sp. 'fantastica']
MKDAQTSLLEQDAEQTPRLPQDIFPSYFRYELFQRKGAYYALAAEIAGVGLVIFMLLLGANKVACGVLGFLLAFVGLPVTVCLFVGSTLLTDNHKLLMLKMLVAEDPGMDSEKWNTIAAKLNRAFHALDPSISPYFFYNGGACLSFFRANMLRIYSYTRSIDDNGTPGVVPLALRQPSPALPRTPTIMDNLELGPWVTAAVQKYLAHIDASIQELTGNGSAEAPFDASPEYTET